MHTQIEEARRSPETPGLAQISDLGGAGNLFFSSKPPGERVARPTAGRVTLPVDTNRAPESTGDNHCHRGRHRDGLDSLRTKSVPQAPGDPREAPDRDSDACAAGTRAARPPRTACASLGGRSV